MDKVTELLNRMHKSVPAKNLRDPKSASYFIKSFEEYSGYLVVLGVFITLTAFLYSLNLNNLPLVEEKILNGLFLTSLQGVRFFSLLIVLFLSVVFVIHLFTRMKRKYNAYYPIFTLLIFLFLLSFYVFFFTINVNTINQIFWFIAGISLAFFFGFKYHKLRNKYLLKIKQRAIKIFIRIILSAILILIFKKFISILETSPGLQLDGTMSNFGFLIFNMSLLFLILYLIGDLLFNISKIFRKI